VRRVQAGLRVDYDALAERDASRLENVLGVVAFDTAPPELDGTDVPVAEINTPLLGASAQVCEIWRSARPIKSGRRGGVHFRRDADVLFGCVSVDEAVTAGMLSAAQVAGAARSALHAATGRAYRDIFSVLDEVGYRHLLRIWNYLPQINAESGGTERYWQFNDARREALIECGRDVAGNVPAACALGSTSGSPLSIYFLASRCAPAAIENPRQTSAYHYPAQYGPRPAFARASVLETQESTLLFISGTASIVGHQTVHLDDAAAQARETLTNIEALLGEANRLAGAGLFGLDSLAYKVYVRRPSDLPAIQAQLARAVGPSAGIVYLQADICRQELLVEIEASGAHVAAGSG